MAARAQRLQLRAAHRLRAAARLQRAAQQNQPVLERLPRLSRAKAVVLAVKGAAQSRVLNRRSSLGY
jgi:hypothetical protein